MGASGIAASVAAHEAWMHGLLGRQLVQSDLAEKHKRMGKGPHAMLRATCFRFAELAPELPGRLMDAPRVLSVGDLHVENFGLWRDAEGRLVWGINDFDEAARLPWPLDLVRLCASALLAARPGTLDAGQAASALLKGYRAGLAEPAAHVLEAVDFWLRDAFLADDAKRGEFWQELQDLFPPPGDAPKVTARQKSVLRAALPRWRPGGRAADARFAPRSGGLGSRGRPRVVVLATFQHGPVVREAKAALPSCFVHAGLAVQSAAPGAPGVALATGRFRAPDPWLALRDGLVVRRLAPDSRKLEVADLGGTLGTSLLEAMGREVGAVHRADPGHPAVADAARARRPPWLAKAATALATATTEDWRQWQRTR